jgi:hypothetical protein
VERENEDFDLGTDLQDLARGLKSIEARHPDVQDDYVRLQFKSFVYSFPAVSCFAANLPVWLGLQQGAQTAPNDLVIIRHHDSESHCTTSRT